VQKISQNKFAHFFTAFVIFA